MKPIRLYGAIAVVVIAVVGVVLAVLLTRGGDDGDGGSGAQPSGQAQALQQQLGADSCTNSGFVIDNAADGTSQIVYDCAFGSRRRCITVTNNIARDATADVRRLYANGQGGARPSCLGS